MSIKLASLNARDLRDQGKVARLLHDCLSFEMDAVTIQETHIAKSMLVCYLATFLSIQKCFLAG